MAGQGATWLDRRERGEGEKDRKREEEEEEREVGRFLPFKGALLRGDALCGVLRA